MIRISANFNLQYITLLSRNYSRWGNEVSADHTNTVIKIHNEKNIDSFEKSTQHINSTDINVPKLNDLKLYEVVTKMIGTPKFKKFEFLGDAYLDLVVSTILLQTFPTYQKNVLIEMLYNITNNKNFEELIKKSTILENNENSFKNSKVYADVFEAYFGAISYEAYISKEFNQNNDIIRVKWNDTIKYMRRNIKYLDKYGSVSYISDPCRRLTQLRNTMNIDLQSLFNYKLDDYQSRFASERCIFLGTYVIKYFLTKLYHDNLNRPVNEISTLRDSRLKEQKINFLAEQIKGKSSYSLFYSLFNKNKNKNNVKNTIKNTNKNTNKYINKATAAQCVNHIKIYLGYIAINHFPYSYDKKCNQLFQLGWKTCESLIYDIYFKDMQEILNKQLAKNKHKLIVDPTILDRHK